MKLFLAFIIAGFFMAADALLYKKCFAPVYCLSSDSTESKNVTTTWAQVYPSLIEAAPDKSGCSITSNPISAEAEQQIKEWEEKLSSLQVKVNETTQYCTDELQRQLNVTKRCLRTTEIAINETERLNESLVQTKEKLDEEIDKSKQLNDSLMLAIKEKEGLNGSLVQTKEKLDEEIDKCNQLNENLTLSIKKSEGLDESLVQTQGKLDEEIDKSKQLNDSLMLAIKEKEGLNGSLVQIQGKLNEEINKSKQLNKSLMLSIKEKEGLNESLVQIKEELVEEQNKSTKLTQEADRMKNALKGFCPISYNDKCFFFNMKRNVVKKEAKNRCAGIGGTLGNIYDETHFNETVAYVRENYMTGRAYVDLWLGMTFENNTVRLSNETEAKYWKWGAGGPTNIADYTPMLLGVKSSTTNVDQYMWNYYPDLLAYPFCEL